MRLPPPANEFLTSLKAKKKALGLEITDQDLLAALREVRTRQICRIIETSFRGKGLAFIDECIEHLSRPAPLLKKQADEKVTIVKPAQGSRMLDLYPDE